jgi:N-acetylglucosamine kinase-like BadF-type ATPase
VYQGSRDRTDLAALAPEVLAAADAGDEVAADIVLQEAEELAYMAATVAAALQLGRGPVPLALAGGVLRESPGYQAKVEFILNQHGIRAEPVTVVRVPAEGAVRRAVQLLAERGGS